MSYIKRAIEEIRDRGWPQTNESLERLMKEKEALKKIGRKTNQENILDETNKEQLGS